jgi:hypothetical protein
MRVDESLRGGVDVCDVCLSTDFWGERGRLCTCRRGRDHGKRGRGALTASNTPWNFRSDRLYRNRGMPGTTFFTNDHDDCVSPNRPFCMFSSNVSRLRGSEAKRGEF